MKLMKLCPCGSGNSRRELKDAAGIFCTFVCDSCEAAKRAKFNPAIFEQGSQYAITGQELDIADAEKWNRRKIADQVDGYDRDDLGESPDY